MDEENCEVVEIQIDEELRRKVEELIIPMGLTMERLLQLFFEWLFIRILLRRLLRGY